jgi:transcriptional regulator with XRE-family HTH domain
VNKWDDATAIVIVACRREVKMSQDDLMKKLGWNRTTISKIESRKRRVSVSEFIQIAEALGFHPEIMFARIIQWVRCWEAFKTGRPLIVVNDINS